MIGVEIEGRLFVPRTVGWDFEFHRRRIPIEAAGSPSPGDAVVTDLRVAALEGDEGHVTHRAPLGLVAGTAQQRGKIGGTHHHPIHGLAAGIHFVIHLEKGVGVLREIASTDIRRRRPGAPIAGGIHGFHIELGDRRIRLGRQHRAINTIARRTVIAQAIV